MRAVVQRVARASVTVDGAVIGAIDRGFLVLLGVADGDPAGCEELLARKLALLRVFNDEQGKMNRSVVDVGGAVLVVSQFTLLADCKKGNRPSFIGAAKPEVATARYEAFCKLLRDVHGLRVETGRFGADMKVELLNDGPVTITLDTDHLGLPRDPEHAPRKADAFPPDVVEACLGVLGRGISTIRMHAGRQGHPAWDLADHLHNLPGELARNDLGGLQLFYNHVRPTLERLGVGKDEWLQDCLDTIRAYLVSREVPVGPR